MASMDHKKAQKVSELNTCRLFSDGRENGRRTRTKLLQADRTFSGRNLTFHPAVDLNLVG